jgi:hypothetical protein
LTACSRSPRSPASSASPESFRGERKRLPGEARAVVEGRRGREEEVVVGEAELPEIEAFLKAIPVRGKSTLLDTTKRWIAAGAKLGKLEIERAEQEAKEATQPLGKAAITSLRARWIRLVSQMLSNLELTDAEAEAIEVIRGPVLKAADRAGKRYEGAGASPAKEPAGPADDVKTP